MPTAENNTDVPVGIPLGSDLRDGPDLLEDGKGAWTNADEPGCSQLDVDLDVHSMLDLRYETDGDGAEEQQLAVALSNGRLGSVKYQL